MSIDDGGAVVRRSTAGHTKERRVQTAAAIASVTDDGRIAYVVDDRVAVESPQHDLVWSEPLGFEIDLLRISGDGSHLAVAGLRGCATLTVLS